MPTVGTVVKNEGTWLDGGASFDTTVDVGSGANRALIIGVVMTQDAAMAGMTATFNGTSLSLTSAITYTGTIDLRVGYLSAPASGSHTLAIAFADGHGNAPIGVIAVPLTNAHQTTASLITHTVTNVGSGGSPISDNITSATGDLVIDLLGVVYVAGGPAMTAGAGQTELEKNTALNGGTVGFGMSSEAGGSTVTMSWTAATIDNATGHIAVSVAAPASAITGGKGNSSR